MRATRWNLMLALCLILGISREAWAQEYYVVPIPPGPSAPVPPVYTLVPPVSPAPSPSYTYMLPQTGARVSVPWWVQASENVSPALAPRTSTLLPPRAGVPGWVLALEDVPPPAGPVQRCLNQAGVDCRADPNAACSNLHAELRFIFGSCRTYFGETCVPNPAGSHPWRRDAGDGGRFLPGSIMPGRSSECAPAFSRLP